MADTPTTGTEVTLVVQPGTAVPETPPTAPRPPLAHTGFELVTALALTALLLALGAVLFQLGRRPSAPHLSRRTS